MQSLIDAKTLQNTKIYKSTFGWTIGNGNPMLDVYPIVHETSKIGMRVKNSHNNNSK